MNADDSEHLNELITVLTKRLRKLEVRAAQEGPACPPEVAVEIEGIGERIAQIKQQLDTVPAQDFFESKTALRAVDQELDMLDARVRRVEVHEEHSYHILGWKIWSVKRTSVRLLLIFLLIVISSGMLVFIRPMWISDILVSRPTPAISTPEVYLKVGFRSTEYEVTGNDSVVVVPVVLNQPSDEQVVVSYDLTIFANPPDIDPRGTSMSRTVVFEPGETVASIVVDTERFEGSESVRVMLTSSDDAELLEAQSEAVITFDDSGILR